MFTVLSSRVLRVLSIMTVAAASANAQCLDWRAIPENTLQTFGGVTAATAYDAGFGANLFIGGSLRSPQAPYAIRSVLRWDGIEFHDVPGGLTGTINDLFSHDDGTGLALYAIGTLNINSVSVGGIARWNGSAWNVPGPGIVGSAYCWTIFDDGTGTALYVGGPFFTSQGGPGDRIARWDGTSWSGFAPFPSNGAVRALAGFDDGAGMKLFAGAGSIVGGLKGAFRLDSGTWTQLGPGTSSYVTAMQVCDDGSGPSLFLSGSFVAPTLTGIVRWNGAGYQPVGTGLPSGGVSRLAALDTGSGPTLHAFTPSQTAPIRVWNGSTWGTIPGGVPPYAGYSAPPVFATVFDSGSGPRIVGITPGTHPFAYGCTIATWTGSAWIPFQTHTGFTGVVRCLETLDFGSGPRLCAGGGFAGAGTASTDGIAIWNGTDWTRTPLAVPTSATVVTALGTLHTVTTTYLCATRSTPGAPTFSAYPMTGSSVQAFGTGSASDQMFALQEFGNSIYIGGVFTHLGGPTGTPTPNLGRWTGSSIVAMGVGMNGAVNALTTFDDGTGLALYAAGTFTLANGTPANRIGRWDGTNWTALGSGLNDLCDTLVGFDDGTGPALFAAGTFTTAGGIPASCVAKWQNGAWSALGAGLNAQVLKLAAFDDGSGPALYAGGNFTASGSTPIDRIARWNGVNWTAVGAGVDGTVWAMQSFDSGNGAGRELFVGGTFHNAAQQDSDYMAVWRGCAGTIARYCFGDGTVAPCPCGNTGLAARGCDNSFATGGARMNASGTTNPDAIEFYLAGLIPGTATMLFQGSTALSAPISFGDGLLCAGGQLLRLELAFAGGGTLGFPNGGGSISALSAALGDPLVPGTVRGYQAWYRDANLSFCSTATSNLSNAVRIAW